MTRKYVDCRETGSISGCSVSIAADNEDELMEAAVQHARAVHQEEDTPELRAEIRRTMHEETPQAERRL